jgi:hypothetical protein
MNFEELFPKAKNTDTYPCDVPFISPAVIKDIIRNLNSEITNIKSLLMLNDKIIIENDWDITLMNKLLLKGINSVSIHPSVLSIREGLKAVKDKANFFMELGCGAGWSTLIFATELMRNNFDNFSLISVDNSIPALATTKLLLQSFGLDVTVEDFSSINNFQINKKRGSIKLVYGNFADIFSKIDKSPALVWSNFGVSYLNYQQFNELEVAVRNNLEEGDILLMDALSSEYLMRLDKAEILRRVIRGNNRKYFIEQEDKIIERKGKKIFSASNNYISACMYDFLHYLLFSHPFTFIFYIRAISMGSKLVNLLGRINKNEWDINADYWNIIENKRTSILYNTILAKRK